MANTVTSQQEAIYKSEWELFRHAPVRGHNIVGLWSIALIDW